MVRVLHSWYIHQESAGMLSAQGRLSLYHLLIYLGPWGHRGEAGEIRRGRWEGPSRRSGRGAEGDCPAHSGPEIRLSSQDSPLPSKAPPSSPLPLAALVLGA